MKAIATQNREDPRPGDEVLEENVSDKTQFATDAPAGAALIAQAMDRREGAGRYKAMQSIMDWDRSRLVYRAVKRAFDVVFSGCVLAVIAVPSLVLAAAIRLESEGNPFYSQIRVGQTHRDGSLSTFRMWKFRSMYKDADERLAELKEQNEIAGAMFKMKEDPRVTKIGRFIRKHSIDEFPQFLNVFLGQIPLRILKTRPEFSEKSMGAFALPAKSSTNKGKAFSQVVSCFANGLRMRRISKFNCNRIRGMEAQFLAKPVFGAVCA